MVQVFISYKRAQPETTLIKEDTKQLLEALGYQPLVDEGISVGDRWSDKLYLWLMECSAAVVIISTEAHSSTWCRREWEVLAARAIVDPRFRLVLVRVADDVEIPEVLKDFQSIVLPAGEKRIAVMRTAMSGISNLSAGKREYLALHRAWLTTRFKVLPAIGAESFSLESVYTDLDCGNHLWGEISNHHSPVDPFEDKPDKRFPLLATVMDLMSDTKYRDAIVIQGPAGSGKSSFCLSFASHLLQQGFHPLLVRFRDLRTSVFSSVPELLSDACRIGPDEELTPQAKECLIQDEDWQNFVDVSGGRICKTVVILDGWDEVSILGNTGYKAQLGTWLPKIRDYFVRRAGLPMRLVITGRPSLEVRDSGLIGKTTRILTTKPLTKLQFTELTTKIVQRSSWPISEKQRKHLSEQYELNGEKVLNVLNYPLLTLLALKTFAEFDGTIQQFEMLLSSPTALYKTLIDQTSKNSGKMDGEWEQTILKGGDSLRRLLQITASMITTLGSEQISFLELEKRIANLPKPESLHLEEWVETDTEDNPYHRLVINFYFKGGHKDLGCEFLHKSFREYLFAESVVQTIMEFGKDAALNARIPTLDYWQDFEIHTPHYSLSRGISPLLAPNWMTAEVREHLFWLLEKEIERDTELWVGLRDVLADIYDWWAEGKHLRSQPNRTSEGISWSAPYITKLSEWALPFDGTATEPQRLASLDAQLGDALMQVVAFVHWKLLDHAPAHQGRVYQLVDEKGKCRFRPGGDKYFCQLVSRIDVGSVRPAGRRCSGAFLKGICLDGEMLVGEIFDSAMMQGVSMKLTKIWGTRFVGANLKGADFTGSQFDGVDFSHAFLKYAKLSPDQLYAWPTNADPPDEVSERYLMRTGNWDGTRMPEGIPRVVTDKTLN